MTGLPAEAYTHDLAFMPATTEGRSLENPSTPLSAPDDWLYDALGSYKSSSGVNVNAQTALTYSAVWRCVNLIANDCGRLPLHVYQRVERGRKKDYRHPAYRMLRYKPNSEMMSMTFRKTLQAHALLNGNGYAYILRDGASRPLELLPLNPTQIYPVRAGGKLKYIYTNPATGTRKIDPEDIFHLKGLSFDGLIGYSVIAKARESLGLGMAMQTYGSVFFRNNAQPRVVLVYPNQLKKEARDNLRENWERIHSGLENAHRTAVLDQGATINSIGINARDSQLIESRQFEIREVANWFAVPGHKAGDTTRTSFNSLEQENQQYLDEGLSPWLHAWEEECWDKLLSEEEKRKCDHWMEFDTRVLLRANLTARGVWYKDAIGSGIMTPNQAREEEGYNPRTDPDGDKYQKAAINTEWVGGNPDEDDEADDSPAALQGVPDGELLDLPDIRQHDHFSCGAAAAMSVGGYFGVGPATLEEWKAALGTSEKDSTKPFAIVQYLTELGLSVTASGGLTIDDLRECWKRGNPVICPVQEYGVPSKPASFAYGHYVTVIGAALGHVFVQDSSIDNALEGEGADQAPGRMLITEADWLKNWHDVDADGKQYLQFGIIVGKEIPKTQEAPPPDAATPPAKPGAKTPPAKPPAKPARAEDPAILDAHGDLIADAARRMAKRIGLHARRAAKKPAEFLAFVDGLEAEHLAVMVEAMSPAIRAGALLVGRECDPGQVAGDFLKIIAADLREWHAKAPDDLPAAVEACMRGHEDATPAALAAERLAPGRAPRGG